MRQLLQPTVSTLSRRALAGLHGAAVSIMGRREAVVKESSEALEAEHIRCLGVQVRKAEVVPYRSATRESPPHGPAHRHNRRTGV